MKFIEVTATKNEKTYCLQVENEEIAENLVKELKANGCETTIHRLYIVC